MARRRSIASPGASCLPLPINKHKRPTFLRWRESVRRNGKLKNTGRVESLLICLANFILSMRLSRASAMFHMTAIRWLVSAPGISPSAIPATERLEWINVTPERRASRIASDLLRLLARWFATQNASRICVDVEPSNVAARRFYKRQGSGGFESALARLERYQRRAEEPGRLRPVCKAGTHNHRYHPGHKNA